MAQKAFRIAASVDDTYDSTSLGNLPTAAIISSGHGAGGPDHTAYLRWSINIPKRSTIVSAQLQVRVTGIVGSTQNLSIRLIDEDNCPALGGDPSTLTVIGSAIAWDVSTWTINKWAYSDDISALVQSYVNRAGYIEGNYIGIRIHANLAIVGFGEFRSWDGQAALSARLIIDYDRPPAVGVEAFCGIGVEGTPGTGVLIQDLLELVRTEAGVDAPPLVSQSIRNEREFERTVPGGITAGGTTLLEITHAQWTRALYGLMGTPTTTGVGPYTHTFTLGERTVTVTWLIKTGDYYRVWPGCMVESIEFRQPIHAILQAGVNLVGREMYTYLLQQDVVEATAVYDSTLPWSFTDCNAMLDGSTLSNCAQWSMTISQGDEAKRVVRRARAAVGAIRGDGRVSGRMLLYFDTLAELRRFLGNSGTSFPWKHSETVVRTGALRFSYASGADSVDLYADRVFWQAATPPIERRELVWQAIEYMGLYDDTQATLVRAVVVNSETNAEIVGAGTDITELPA